MSPRPALNRSLRSQKNRGAKRWRGNSAPTIWLTQPPQSTRTETNDLQNHSTWDQVRSGHENRSRIFATRFASFLALAHSKSVDIPKHLARLFDRIVIVSQNYCAIFITLAQRIGTCLVKVLTDSGYCSARITMMRGEKV